MPKVSIVILNWNGKKFLKDCLRSLATVTYRPLETIVVDNNSSDGSCEYVRAHFPKVRLIVNSKNYGFAAGNNMGWKAATGDYILFLNNDTVVTPHFLDALIKDYKTYPMTGCIQPEMRVMSPSSLLDTAGSYLTFTGFLYHYGYRKPFKRPLYQKRREIFSAKGACMLIPRNVLETVGGFDEDFFIFFEETDLCHRIWLCGYTILYEPEASIFHLAGGDTSNTYNRARRIYLTFKNMNYAYLKNFGTRFLFTIYPVFISFQIGLLIFFLITLKIHLVHALLLGWWWNLKHYKEIFRKRKHIQSRLRKVSDATIENHILHNPGLYYYYCLLFDAKRYQDTYIRSPL